MSLIVPTHHPASMLSPAEPAAIAHAVLSVKAEALKAALYMCVCMCVRGGGGRRPLVVASQGGE